MEGDGAIYAVGGVAFALCAGNWWSRRNDGSRLELVTKPLATLALAALAIVAATAGPDDAPTGALIAAITGFALCLTGDLALLPSIDKFVVGLGAFLAGHVAFVVMFVMLGLDRPWMAPIALVGVAAVAATFGRRIVAGAAGEAPGYVRPVQAYLAVICSMAVVGWATGRPAAMAGSGLFVASDSILGWNKFVGERPWMAVAIMVTYHAALAGLAVSLR